MPFPPADTECPSDISELQKNVKLSDSLTLKVLWRTEWTILMTPVDKGGAFNTSVEISVCVSSAFWGKNNLIFLSFNCQSYHTLWVLGVKKTTTLWDFQEQWIQY